jgi:hypothetical protein
VLSPAARRVEDLGLLFFVDSAFYHLEVELDGGRQEKAADLRPGLPLVQRVGHPTGLPQPGRDQQNDAFRVAMRRFSSLDFPHPAPSCTLRPLRPTNGWPYVFRAMEKRTLQQLEDALAAVGQDLSGRVEELAEKSTAGSLTGEEQAEYAEIVRLNDLLSLLKIEAEEVWSIRAAS